MKMTNKQFCARLREAKKLAVRNYPNFWCIATACGSAGLIWGKVAIFDKGGLYENRSAYWVRYEAKFKSHIAAVFDNSIRNLGEEP